MVKGRYKTGIYINCKICGKETYVPPYLIGKKKFCSKECCWKSKIKRYFCTICGDEIHGRKNPNIKYCSIKCSRIGSRTGKIVKCDYCGKEVYVIKSKLKLYELHYCSKDCFSLDPKRGERISEAKMGHEVSIETRKKLSEFNKGSNSFFYIDGRSSERSLFYRSFEWRLLSQQTRKRDNFVCQECDKKGWDVHHILPIRLGGPHELWNLITYCRKCHVRIERQSGFIKI